LRFSKNENNLWRPFLEIDNLSKTAHISLEQGKKVCKTTAFRCYQCFNLRLLLFLASRVEWSPEKKKEEATVVFC